MGNTSSNATQKAPVAGERLDDGNGFHPHHPPPAHRTVPTSGVSSISPDKLRHSLREKGLMVGESDVREVLTKQTTMVNALASLIESGKARRSFKPRISTALPTSRGNHRGRQEHLNATSLEPPGTAPMLQKRGRHEENDALGVNEKDTGGVTSPAGINGWARTGDGRPPKRVTLMIAPPSEPSPDNQSRPTVGSTFPEQPKAPASRQSQAPDACSTETRVLVPVQPSSTPSCVSSTQDKVTQCSSVAAPSTPSTHKTRTGRTFENLPQHLDLGSLEATILSVVGKWSMMSPGDKAETIRTIERILQLPPTEAQRAERLRKELSSCFQAALVDLSRLPGSRDEGVKHFSWIVCKIRKSIHTNSIGIAGSYAKLHPPSSRDCAAKPECIPESAGDVASPRASLSSPTTMSQQASVRRPYGTCTNPYSRAFSMSTTKATCVNSGVVETSSMGARGMSPRTFESASMVPNSPQSGPSLPSLNLGFASEVSGEAAPIKDTPASSSAIASARNSSPTAQDVAFWTCLRICEAALSRAMLARKEGEWLANQVPKLHQCTRISIAEREEAVKEVENEIKNLDVEVRRAADETESLTQEVIKTYLNSDVTKEASLRALLTTIQKGNDAEQQMNLHKRQHCIENHEKLATRHRLKNTELSIHKRALEVTTILSKELYADVINIVEDIAQEANERRLSCRTDLKITTKDALNKMYDAISFHVKRKSKAEDRVQRWLEEQKEERLLYGETYAANSSKAQARIDEMRAIAQDSAAKMKNIKMAADQFHSSLQAELSADDMEGFVESAKQFFKSNDDLVAVQSGGCKPSGHEEADRSAMSTDQEDPCNLM